MNDPATPISQLNTAFDEVDVAAFRRLLTEHPELLRNKNGTDRWMWYAAQKGRLSLIEVLYDLGIGVNESKAIFEPENPYSQIEGAILQAAGEGHLEIVKWFLDRGAQINFEINGQIRCLPLQFAATEGHLDVVKLLVEHGAAIDSSHLGTNPIKQAQDYGHTAVYEFLTAELAKQKANKAPGES